MRSTRRAAATLLVVAITTLASACVTPTTPAAPDPATVGLHDAGAWLVTRFDPATHLIPSEFVPGAADPGSSSYAVTSLRLAGLGSATADAAVSALAPLVDTYVVDSGGHDRPGALARLILAVESVGADPHSFGGFDLVARLEATIQTTGPDAGRFGAQDATYDGAFRQGLALAALSLVTPTPASIDPGAGTVEALPAVAWLLDQQCADGSWMPYRSDLGEACVFSPITYAGPDTNSTALAELGLHAVGATAGVSPLTWLNTVRNADGGWSFDGAPGSSTDPDSTGLVMAALRALGVTPDAQAVSALLSFQLDTAAPVAERGAFFYPYGPPAPNLVATNDAIVGLSDEVWPASLDD